MAKQILSAVFAAVVLMLFSVGCDESSSGKSPAPSPSSASSAEKPRTEKPRGVPTSTYNKVKSLEAQHNDQVEKALKN